VCGFFGEPRDMGGGLWVEGFGDGCAAGGGVED